MAPSHSKHSSTVPKGKRDQTPPSNSSGLDQFAPELQNLIKEDGNFVYCPLGLGILMASLQLGARGETAQKIREAMKFPRNENLLVDQWAKRIRSILQNKTQGLEINISQRVRYQQEFDISSSYKKILEKLRMEIKHMDFEEENESNSSNDWVKTETKGMIEEIVNPAMLEDKVLILVNTVYFKGMWKESFNKNRTQKPTFTSLEEESSRRWSLRWMKRGLRLLQLLIVTRCASPCQSQSQFRRLGWWQIDLFTSKWWMGRKNLWGGRES